MILHGSEDPLVEVKKYIASNPLPPCPFQSQMLSIPGEVSCVLSGWYDAQYSTALGGLVIGHGPARDEERESRQEAHSGDLHVEEATMPASHVPISSEEEEATQEKSCERRGRLDQRASLRERGGLKGCKAVYSQ